MKRWSSDNKALSLPNMVFTTVSVRGDRTVVIAYFTDEFQLFLTFKDVFNYISRKLCQSLVKTDIERAIQALPMMWTFIDRQQSISNGQPETDSNSVVETLTSYGLRELFYDVMSRRLKLFSDWTHDSQSFPPLPAVYRRDGTYTHRWPDITPLVRVEVRFADGWLHMSASDRLSFYLRTAQFPEAVIAIRTTVEADRWAVRHIHWYRYTIHSGIVTGKTLGVHPLSKYYPYTRLYDLLVGLKVWALQQWSQSSQPSVVWPESVLEIIDNYVIPNYVNNYENNAWSALEHDVRAGAQVMEMGIRQSIHKLWTNRWIHWIQHSINEQQL